jgi:hypothetical protein
MGARPELFESIVITFPFCSIVVIDAIIAFLVCFDTRLA